MNRIKKSLTGIAAAGAAAGLVFGLTSGEADAAHSIAATKDKPVVWGCVNPATSGLVGGRFYIYDGSNRYPGCNSWAEKVWWYEGNGAPGSDSAVAEQATASTSITNWPETSGWANDNFTRQVTVTRQEQVDASHCGATAQQCYFYTATLQDNGTFQAIDGKPSPNSSIDATITGNPSGSMDGVAKVEFYASSNKPDGSLVPAVQNGHGAYGTTDWAKQFFPSDTVFGTFTLPTYSWTYAEPCEGQHWVDQINPGDDGQGSGDGNITAACPTS